MTPSFPGRIAGLLFFAAIATGPAPAGADEPDETKAGRPVVKVVEGGESTATPEGCIGTLIGPGKNQPDPFPGYTGFVGWNSPIRLRNGDWLIGFSAGYWHASPPTPLRYSPKTQEHVSQNGNAGRRCADRWPRDGHSLDR